VARRGGQLLGKESWPAAACEALPQKDTGLSRAAMVNKKKPQGLPGRVWELAQGFPGRPGEEVVCYGEVHTKRREKCLLAGLRTLGDPEGNHYDRHLGKGGASV